MTGEIEYRVAPKWRWLPLAFGIFLAFIGAECMYVAVTESPTENVGKWIFFSVGALALLAGLPFVWAALTAPRRTVFASETGIRFPDGLPIPWSAITGLRDRGDRIDLLGPAGERKGSIAYTLDRVDTLLVTLGAHVISRLPPPPRKYGGPRTRKEIAGDVVLWVLIGLLALGAYYERTVTPGIGIGIGTLVMWVTERRKRPYEIELGETELAVRSTGGERKIRRSDIVRSDLTISRGRYGRRNIAATVVLANGQRVALAARGAGPHELYHAVNAWLGN